MYKSFSYSTLKINKSKILYLTILFHFFTSTMLCKAFGTKLHTAIDQEDKKAVQRLLAAKKVDINSKNRNKMTPLHLAIEKGNNEIVQLLLDSGVDVSVQCKNRNTALHIAVENGNTEIVKFLLESGADVNAQGYWEKTPLHTAVSLGNTEMVKLLISAGADVKAKERKHITPLHMAILPESGKGSAEIVELLLAAGADVNVWDLFNRTPLGIAAESGNLEIVRLLIESKAELNAQVTNKNTPLHLAAQQLEKSPEIVRLLIESGAELEARNEDENAPLHFATSWSSAEIVGFLIDAGADVKARNKNEETPLYFAIHGSERDMVQLLLISGADARAINKSGNTFFTLLQEALQRICFVIRKRCYFSREINIFIELLLWSRYQTYSDPLFGQQQQADFFEMIRNLDLNVFNQNHPLLNSAKNLIQWIITELLKCDSKEEFFQKIFDYLLNSCPQEQENLLMENIQHLILKEHQANLYPQETTLSESQRQKLKAFKSLLRLTYAKKLKKELFHDLSETELESQLNHVSALRQISKTIQKYCQNTPIKLPFLEIILEKYQFNQTIAVRDWALHYCPETNPGAREVYSNIFKAHFTTMKCLVRDLYMHLKCIIDQPLGSDRLDSDTQFGRDKTHQDILTFGKDASSK